MTYEEFARHLVHIPFVRYNFLLYLNSTFMQDNIERNLTGIVLSDGKNFA